MTVALLTDTVHHLEVLGRVRVIEHDGCIYGGYTLRTDRDRLGAPLIIKQSEWLHTCHLPLVLRR